MNKMNKVYDCFIFYNEISLLKYRVEVLKDVVDYFVLVEATRSHVGKPKPLFFQENQHLFKENIIHVVIDDLIENANIENRQQWENETRQRNGILHGLKGIQDNDIIISGDLDEIPDPRTLKYLKNLKGIYNLEQDLYYCNIQHRVVEKWNYCKIMDYYSFCKSGLTFEQIRYTQAEPIPRGGWHLSYFGTPEFIANKIKNFIHQEFNEEKYTDCKKIQDRINNGKDLFDRNNIVIEKVEITTNEYPIYKWYLLQPSGNPLRDYYNNRKTIVSDINEHLETLYTYALECESIFETGVRTVVSSYAFAYALSQNNKTKKSLILNDIVECDTSEISDLCKINNIELKCMWCNNLNLTFTNNVDLTFIDTWHVYGQLKRELNHFKDITNKYIILHDTTVDRVYGESIRLNRDIPLESKQSGIPFEEICQGLGRAVDEFLKSNDDWVIIEEFTHNNGLTILGKR